MRRRTLLTSFATLAATAGCVSGGEAPAEQPTDDATPSPTDVHTDTRTMTDTPASPPDATDVFADFDCPSFDDNADETVCYHAADGSDLVLTAEPEVFDPSLGDDDVETLEFVLYNRSEWPVSFNPYAWGIERYDDGEWSHVAPEMHPEPMTEVASGSTMRWVLPAESGHEPADDDHPLSVALDAGVYAFHISLSYGAVSMDTPTDAPKPDERVELVALFRVEQQFDPESEGTSSGPSTKSA